MDLQRFFDHWKLKEHPFQAEEALNDAVYNRMLKAAITHPDFTKIYGDPVNPGTTIVFGEKGSGKTAIRLMIQRKLKDYNESRDSDQVFVVSYEELNPLLDRLARHMKTNDGEKIMKSIRLADHQDAILSLAVTKLLDEALEPGDKATSRDMVKILKKMDLQKRMNLAALALLYDHPKHAQASDRWNRLLRILKMKTAWDRTRHGLFFAITAVIGIIGGLGWSFLPTPGVEWIAATLVGIGGAVLLGAWWLLREWRNTRRGRQLSREIRAVVREKGETAEHLWSFRKVDNAAPLFPAKIDQDSRYELTGRFLDVIRDFGYSSLIVLMDRVDEPVLVNGDAKRMKLLVWPMLNNKFLQQERIGVKMLLPIELSHLLASEDMEFKRQARLDKQNVVNPLKWTGTTLYDLCSWRFKNCQTVEDHIPLDAMFDDDVQSAYLIEALDQMHQPRDAFKFLYAVILEHCRNTPGDSEDYQISRSTLDFVRRQQSERVVDLYRGVATS
ncbi:MAG: hypothetical protein R3F50_05470 [Gammaproteobacteria bacterium]|jgi:hypothetical protein